MKVPKSKEVTPSGTLYMKVYGATYVPVEIINTKMGWNENIAEYNEDVETSEVEKKVTNSINNMRMNPLLYFDKFIDKKNMVLTKDFIDNVKRKELPSFALNDGCYFLLDAYFSNGMLCEEFINMRKNDSALCCEKMEQKLCLYLNEKFNDKFIIECKLTKKNNENEIANLFLYDDKFRKNIFDDGEWTICVKILEDFFYGQNLVILGLFKDNIDYEEL